MNKALSIALFIAGIALLVFGLNAQDAPAAPVSEVMTGAPTSMSLWLVVLGLVGVIVGGLNSFFGRSSP